MHDTFSVSNTLIDISLTPGLYSIGRNTATCKTRVYSLLHSAVTLGIINYNVIRYDDKISEDEYVRILEEGSYTMVYFDRFDQIKSDKIKELVIRISKKVPVLIDLKDLNKIQIMCKHLKLIVEGDEVMLFETSNIIRRL